MVTAVRKLSHYGIALKRSITYAIFRLCWETMAYNPAFHAYSTILNSSFHAYGAIVDGFVIFCFYVEKHCIPHYYHWLSNLVCACLSWCFGQGDCYSMVVITSCTCSYNRTLHFLIPRSCVYLHSLGKFGFRAKSGFKNKCWARAGFGLVISGSGQVRASKWGPFTTLVWRAFHDMN